VALLVGCRSSNQPAAGGEAESLDGSWEAESLDGSWEVTSVQRDGEPDLLQVGARLTFTGNEVHFQPKTVQFADGTD
jgi:hypothetical protein